MSSPGNFSFLAEHSPLLADLGATAERLFPFDPASCVLKLRLLAEAITQDIAARLGIALLQPGQAELLRAVDVRLGMDAQVRQLFHLLRRTGNLAAHEADHGIGYREGIEALKVARQIAVWFHRSFGRNPDFKPGPFQLPDDPSQKLLALQQQIAALGTQLQTAQTAQASQAEMTRLLEAQAAQERELSGRAREEAAVYQELAEEAGARAATLQAQFDAQLATASQQASNEQLSRFSQRASVAAQSVLLDEAATRQIIDLQLIEAGWEADTVRLTHARGARPERGKNKAIAEWPTQGQQSADYVLFAGLTPMAVVEAKRENVNVAGKIGQAERYARGFGLEAGMNPAWTHAGSAEPWADGQGGRFQIPFVYSSNGRPYVKQLAEKSAAPGSATCAAPSAHTARPLMDFHSPRGPARPAHAQRGPKPRAKLQAGRLRLPAAARLPGQAPSTPWRPPWPSGRQRNCLLAMATGTGKTRTIIGLMYRLLKAERFRRILFLVDRNALGDAGPRRIQ